MNDVKDIKNWHIDQGIDFKLIMTNYTTKIISNKSEFHFMKGQRSTKCFMAYNKLKLDVSGNNLPVIKERDIKYYNSNLYPIYSDKVFNVDIKSCYANILYIDGLIREDTFKFLKSLSKQDRLTSVGMLASTKHIFYFKDGEIISYNSEVSPYSNVFFHCIKRTYEIMQHCKNILKNTFLFSWVDGIYFTGRGFNSEVCKYLIRMNLPYSENVLTDFEVIDEDSCFKLTYTKDKNEVSFYIPKEVKKNDKLELLYNHKKPKTI